MASPTEFGGNALTESVRRSGREMRVPRVVGAGKVEGVDKAGGDAGVAGGVGVGAVFTPETRIGGDGVGGKIDEDGARGARVLGEVRRIFPPMG